MKRFVIHAIALGCVLTSVGAQLNAPIPRPKAGVVPPKADAIHKAVQPVEPITSVTLDPSTKWRGGTTVTIKWDWPGNSNQPVNVTLRGATTVPMLNNWDRSSARWVVPHNLMAGQYSVVVTSVNDAKNFKAAGITLDNSITILRPTKGEVLLMGSDYPITWQWVGKAATEPLILQLVGLSTDGKQQTIGQATWGDSGAGQYKWKLPSTLQTGNRYMVAITSPAMGANVVTSGEFAIETPKMTVSKPSEWPVIAGRQNRIPYTSGYQATLFTLEIVSIAENKVVETVTASKELAPIGIPASGLVSWTPSASHPATFYGPNYSYRVRMTHLASGAVCESPDFPIYFTDPRTAKASTNTPSPSSGSQTNSSSRTTAGSAASASSTNRQSNATCGTDNKPAGSAVLIKANETYQYNDRNRVTFVAYSPVILNVAGCALGGCLQGDQNLEYTNGKAVLFGTSSWVDFYNGCVLRGFLKGTDNLEYCTGKTASFKGQLWAISFKDGYVQDGYLSADTRLEYARDKSARFRIGSYVLFGADHYVQEGQLAEKTSLEYAPGKSTEFNGMCSPKFAKGRVVSGQLASDTRLEYRSGMSTVFSQIGLTTFRPDGCVKSGTLAESSNLATADGKVHSYMQHTFVTFTDSGYVAEAIPPTLQINPQK